MQQLKKFLTRKRQPTWKGMSKLALSALNTRVRRHVQAMERLGKSQRRNEDSEEVKPSKRGKRRCSDAVEYLKEKFELESKLKKDEMEFKKNKRQMLIDQQSQMHKQQLEMM